MPRPLSLSVPSRHSERAGSPGGYPALLGRTVKRWLTNGVSSDGDELEQEMLRVDIVRSAPL